MRIDFYHLTAQPVERVLPRIAERVLADGGRLLVVTADGPQAALLDRQLWEYSPASFLPHGRAGDGTEAEQPVLIAAEPQPLNEAGSVAIVDGRWRDEALGFERAFFLFDGTSIAAARTAWKALADRDEAERRYWKQDESGRWAQQA